jgi:hypothetical protein
MIFLQNSCNVVNDDLNSKGLFFVEFFLDMLWNYLPMPLSMWGTLMEMWPDRQSNQQESLGSIPAKELILIKTIKSWRFTFIPFSLYVNSIQ